MWHIYKYNEYTICKCINGKDAIDTFANKNIKFVKNMGFHRYTRDEISKLHHKVPNVVGVFE